MARVPFVLFIGMSTLLVVLASTLASARVAPLANCPVRCHCDDDTLVVSCSEGHLDVLPIALNPSIQRLEIRKNRIRIVDSSLQFYSELTYMDLSHNKLVGLPARTFSYQKKLLELHLNHNQIGSVGNKTFHGLAQLTVLNMRANVLTAIGASTFAALTQLQELNLGQNRIGDIDANAFRGLANLRVLYLDDNALTAVPSPVFGSVPALAELFIGINRLDVIQPGAFAALTALNRLELQGVQLRNLSLDTFRGLENVRHMDLTGNHLQRIPTVELSTLQRLEELKLGQNEFHVVAESAFVGMSNLRRLDISGSLNLTHIESGAFSANSNLESIILASNKRLAVVQEGAFSGLPHLRHLVLRDNALTTLSEGMFPWAELTTFDLAENPIECDCRVLWLRNVLLSQEHNTSQQQPEQILCAGPSHMHNTPLRLLSGEMLGCAHLEARRHAVVGLILVAAAAFLTALLLLGYRCRAAIVQLLRGQWSAKSGLNGIAKPSDFAKSMSGEDYARFPHPCATLSVHPSLYNYPQLQFVTNVGQSDDYQQVQHHQLSGPTSMIVRPETIETPLKSIAGQTTTNPHSMSVYQLSQEHLTGGGASNKAFSLFPQNFGTLSNAGHSIAMQNAYTSSPPHHHQQQQQQQQFQHPHALHPIDQQQLHVQDETESTEASHYSALQLDYDYAIAVHRNGHGHYQQPLHQQQQHQQHHHNTMASRPSSSAARPLGPAPALPARNGTVTLPKNKRTFH